MDDKEIMSKKKWEVFYLFFSFLGCGNVIRQTVDFRAGFVMFCFVSMMFKFVFVFELENVGFGLWCEEWKRVGQPLMPDSVLSREPQD